MARGKKCRALAESLKRKKERLKRRVVLIREKWNKASPDSGFLVINKKYEPYFSSGAWKLPHALTKVEEGTRLKEKSTHGVFPTYAMKPLKQEQEEADYTRGQGVIGAPLVVKPYSFKDPRAQKIRTEFENTLKAYEKGISTVEPVAVYVDPKTRTGYLYTLAKPAGVPLSKIRYNRMSEKKRKTILSETAKQMKSWHDKGFLHNDAKLKNFLYDNIESKLKLHLNELAKKDREALQLRIGEQEVRPKGKAKVRIEPVDLENAKFLTKSASPRDRGFDLAMFLGDAVYHGLVKNEQDLRLFLESYDPGNSEFWIQELKHRIKEHKKDPVIQNLRKVLK